MSTIIQFCSCDSLVAKLCAKLCACSTEVIKPGTSDADVVITAIICLCVFLIVLIAVLGFISWKLIDHHAKKNVEKRKRDWEEKEIIIKQKSDLLEKYLDFLKDGALKDDKWIQDYKEILASFKESLQKEGAETDKKTIDILENQMEYLKEMGLKSNAQAEEKYIKTLAYLIEKSQTGKMNEISKDHLEKNQNC